MNDLPEDTIKCLDKGFVRLVDQMGGDDAIVQAARVSYGKGTSKVSQDRGLIRYLMRHRHSTPLEMVEFKFHCKMPIFVARQWVRHRTANINEYSLRYSEARDEFYIPKKEHIQFQSSLNKQGRGGEVPKELTEKVQSYFNEISEKTFSIYKELNEEGISRELIRGLLPVNLYTEWYWKNDLHNLLHFIGLRSNSHAQYEIRVFSDAMGYFVKKIAPFAWEAYQDYAVNGLRFSGVEKKILNKHIPKRVANDVVEDLAYRITATLNDSKPRDEYELYLLYKKQGGSDELGDFKIKWSSGSIELGNVREMRELKLKIHSISKS